MKEYSIKDTPELRFPEFNDVIQINRLGDLAKFSSGGTPSKDNLNYWGGDIPWISASSMRGFEYSTSKRTLTKEGVVHGSKIAAKGTVLLLVRGSMLFKTVPVGITLRDVAFNQDVKAISGDSLVDKYLLYYLQASEHTILSKVVGTGIGAGKLDLNDLLNLKIAIPPKEEQQKIADFLTTVDEKITSLHKNVGLLKKYKKGVMQKIFSKEIRFKNEQGKDYPDWKEEKLGKFSDIRTGSQDLQDKNANGKYPFFVRSKNVERIDEYLYDGEAILIPGEGNIGAVVHYVNGKFGFHQRVYKISDFDGAVGRYIYYYFTVYFAKEANKHSVKATVDSLRLPTFQNFKIKLPSMPEQQKIADFLIIVDNKIKTEDAKLAAAKKFKTALLQRMFI